MFDKASNWQDVLPVPQPPAPAMYLLVLGGKAGENQIGAEQRDRANYWGEKAKVWFDEYKFEICQQKIVAGRFASERIEAISKPYGAFIDATSTVRGWLATQSDLSLKRFVRLNISREIIEDYVIPLVAHKREKHQLNESDSSIPPPNTDEQKTKTIFILPDARPGLIEDLLLYVDPKQHKSLKDLINEGVEPEQAIICQCEQVRLGEIFYERVKAQATKDRQIQTEKTKIVKWICQHFMRIESGQIKSPTESVIAKYLKGRGFAQYR